MRVNNDHLDAILDYCEKHPEIITNRSYGLSGRQTLEKSWLTLTNLLNSMEFEEKSVNEWKKMLADLKSKVKQKATKLTSSLKKTGGGLPIDITLTARDERLLSLIGVKSIIGESTLEFGCNPKQQLLLKCSKEQLVNNPAYENDTNIVEEPSHNHLEVVEVDHDYSKNMCSTSKDLQEDFINLQPVTFKSNKSTSHGVGGSKHRREKLELTDKIQQMNNDTLAVLQNIDSNLQNVSYDIKRIADALEILSQKLDVLS